MSKTRHAMVVGAIALTAIVGCSNDRTRVRRTVTTTEDRPPAVQQPETVIRSNRSYERTVEE